MADRNDLTAVINYQVNQVLDYLRPAITVALTKVANATFDKALEINQQVLSNHSKDMDVMDELAARTGGGQ